MWQRLYAGSPRGISSTMGHPSIFLQRLLIAIVFVSLSKTSIQHQENTSEKPNFAAGDISNSCQTCQFGGVGSRLQVEEWNGFVNPRSFVKDYAIPSLPIKMKGAAKQSPGYEQWQTDEYFLSLDIPEDNFVTVETKKKENRSQITVEMHFQDFVEVYNDTSQYMVNTLPSFLGYVFLA